MRRLAFLAALTLSSAAAAQESAPPAAGSDRVVVTGERLDERTVRQVAREFAGAIANPVGSSFGIARWNGRVCIGVQDLPEAAGQFIVDRVSEVALDLGLRPGEPGCTPQIVFMFAVDGRAVATYLAEKRPRAFRPYGGLGGTSQGLAALEVFKSSDAPIRWWHVSMQVDRLGIPAIELNELDGPPTVAGGNSHIRRLVRDELWTATIIVDTTKLNGATWGQLADYLAMVSLAQIDPEADTSGFDSILNLFAAGSAATAPGMTAWDEAYLHALYEFDQDRVPQAQASALVNELTRRRLSMGAD